MSRIRSRIAIHFTVQFVFLWTFIIVAFLAGALIILQYFAIQETKKTFPIGAAATLASEVILDNDTAKVPERWTNMLLETNCWLQIVDVDGKVIYAFNVPDQLPTSYEANQIMQMQDTGKIGAYRLTTYLETVDKNPYFYMLGFEDVGSTLLKEWFQAYGLYGKISSEKMTEFEMQLAASGKYLEVVDPKGEVIQAIATQSKKERYRGLDLLSMRLEPGMYRSDIAVYQDEVTGNAWVLHNVKDRGIVQAPPIMQEVIRYLICIGIMMLILTLAFAGYHGYRYGQPLLLFTDWFKRMGKGHYHEALSEKDRKRVFRKNGKLRRRYRLYQEVIDGFYDMAAKLDASEKERILLEKTREEWMTGISHDLRTPLATIQGYGHLLESGQFQFTNQELTEMGSMIRAKGDYMLELLQDFSFTFQLKNSAFEINEIMELNEIARRTILRYVNDATIQNVSFEFEEYPHDLMIKANTKWFRRILNNLIINAVKHNPAGTQIVVHTSVEAGYAVLIVEDDGVGMDEETRRNLFERYYRGTNTDEDTDGAGLGMSIAKAIIDAHQGTIQVESRAGSGTRITLRFPLHPKT
ncbi:HAMP domain-containing histidine kinase [Paenibacillus sp. N1-5-1-14]|uniref:sensor histidine kinase n=1 Tax=Paenibacillus radicibacter TaxID=2972488 RepID=UPI002158BD2E|nr:HAMP domain-containing sensor histidine kinase [Paenibacillus radicibacter]MCR8643441.1 HAMP domain-containing histidine kinase [Paenibacillus radicibacter]